MPPTREVTTENALQGLDLDNPEERAKLLGAIRASIARVHHDLNNPLAIIAGNAQLFLEIARMMEMEDDLIQPIRDIEAASQRMTALLERLLELKDQIPRG